MAIYDFQYQSKLAIRDSGGAVHSCSHGGLQDDMIGGVASLSLCELRLCRRLPRDIEMRILCMEKQGVNFDEACYRSCCCSTKFMHAGSPSNFPVGQSFCGNFAVDLQLGCISISADPARIPAATTNLVYPLVLTSVKVQEGQYLINDPNMLSPRRTRKGLSLHCGHYEKYKTVRRIHLEVSNTI